MDVEEAALMMISVRRSMIGFFAAAIVTGLGGYSIGRDRGIAIGISMRPNAVFGNDLKMWCWAP